VLQASELVDISAVASLRGLREHQGGTRIGALTTIAELARNQRVRRLYPGLARAAAEVASPQLRNQGTLGGNLCQRPRCWYYRGEFHCLRKGGDTCYAAGGENHQHCIFGGSDCFYVHPSDTAPMLLALGARVELAGPKGPREIALGELFVAPAEDFQREVSLEPGELLTAVLLPAPGPGQVSRYRKVRARRAWDFALAGVALSLQLEGGRVREPRVALTGVAPVPWRARAAEQALDGQPLSPQVIRAAGAAALLGARPMEHNAYKLPLVRAVVEQELAAAAG
jgi:xanthine dehydrogenase YagS FAD-binding subunit